jgi:hypothetical protein
MGRVDDRWTNREQVLVSLAGATQLGLDRRALSLERLQLTNTLAQLGYFGCQRPTRLLSAFHATHLDEDDEPSGW